MNEISASRPSARAELAAITADRVLAGLAAMLAKETEFSFTRLAAEAGVPERTLYRHFADKEALFTAFWGWVNAGIEMPARPATPDEVVEHIPALYAAFDRDEALVRAMLHNPYGRAVRIDQAAARREKFRLALAEVLAGLTEQEQLNLMAAVTVLCSAQGWESIKDNWGLSGAAAAQAAQWAVRTLIDGAWGRSTAGPN